MNNHQQNLFYRTACEPLTAARRKENAARAAGLEKARAAPVPHRDVVMERRRMKTAWGAGLARAERIRKWKAARQ